MAIDHKIIKQAKLALARKDFYYFCQLKNPNFYKEGRKYLEDLCNSLQDFMKSENQVFIVNMPP